MPMTSKKAKVEITFNETSLTGSMDKVPRKATPIPTVTHKATTGRKVSIKIRNTSNNPDIAARVMVAILFE